MLTAVRALAVHKRFQKFPCIIQSSPLIFSRKPDPKPNTNTKVIAAYCDSSEVSGVSPLWLGKTVDMNLSVNYSTGFSVSLVLG